MERWLPTALAALALALGAWNAWSIAGLTAAIEEPAIEESAAVETPAASAWEPRRRDERKPRYDGAAPERVYPKADGGNADAVAVDDPAFHDKVALVMEAEEERRDAERRARFEESMQTEIQAFADEEGIDDATTTALFAQLAERTEAFRAIRDDVRSGALTWGEGRVEMDELRASGDAELERLLGAERAERLQSRLWGDRGGWGPPR